MGPCRRCGKWHCVCKELSLVREWVENREQKAAAIQEHRTLAAKHDDAFQRFMRLCTSRGS